MITKMLITVGWLIAVFILQAIVYGFTKWFDKEESFLEKVFFTLWRLTSLFIIVISFVTALFAWVDWIHQ